MGKTDKKMTKNHSKMMKVEREVIRSMKKISYKNSENLVKKINKNRFNKRKIDQKPRKNFSL